MVWKKADFMIFIPLTKLFRSLRKHIFDSAELYFGLYLDVVDAMKVEEVLSLIRRIQVMVYLFKVLGYLHN